MRTLKDIKRIDERILLEATRKDKEFQLVQIVSQKEWKSNSAVTYTNSTSYEFKWRNIGSTKWCRSEIMSNLNKSVSHLGAFKIFFKALDYSENMTFKELPIFLEPEIN
jgi:hypothetical protein